MLQRHASLVAACCCGTLLAGCADRVGGPREPTAPANAPSTARAADDCVNVDFRGTASLGIVTLPDGTTGFGAEWFDIAIGGLQGEMASVLLAQDFSGRDGRGAVHWTLAHAFRVTATGDYFLTRDRAVCAPAGRDPLSCRVNDALTIVAGTGAFANAGGVLHAHSAADLGTSVLTSAIRGRVCGAGL